MTSAIEIAGLTKRYGPVVGVNDLTLDVRTGEVFGFLGANGAGKTTTIRLLLDLLRPTSGGARILGYDTRRQSFEVRRRVGYLPGEMPIYPELSGAAYLKYLARLGRHRPDTPWIHELFERFNVSAVDLRRPLRDQSHGMKRKFGIIQALMGHPPVLILDEPTSGLDPLMIDAFCETLAALRAEGQTTIFLSSHILSEVERVCDRIGLLSRGRLVRIASLASLRDTFPRRVALKFAHDVNGAAPPPGVTVIRREPQEWILEIRGDIGPVLSSLSMLPLRDIEVQPFRLDDHVMDLYADMGT